MKLKLKESIRNKGQQIRPPAVIDTQELGIGDQQALWLVSRGTAEHYNEPAAEAPAAQQETSGAPADGQPEVIDLGDSQEAVGQKAEDQPAQKPAPEVISLADEPAAEAPAAKKSGKRK